MPLIYRNNDSFPLTATEIDDNFEYLAKRENYVDIYAFGAVADGVSDDGPALQEAVDFVAAKGGGIIYLPPKVFAYSTTLTINKSNVLFRGIGGGNRLASGDSTFDNVATRFKWIGAEDGMMAYVGAIEGGTDKCVNSGFEDVCFDANSLAGTGVEFRSIFRPRLARVRFHEFSVTALLLDIVEVLTQNRNTNEGWLQAVSIYNVTRAGNGITIQRTTELSGGNVSNNVFSDVTCTTYTGHGLVLGCSDNLTFTDCRFAISSGGAGKSIRILASERDSTDVPRAIVFDHVSYDSIEVTTGTYMPRSINIVNFDVDNATPVPSVTPDFYPGRYIANDGRDIATTITAASGTLDLGLSGTTVIDAAGSGETVTSFGPRQRRLYAVRFTHAMTLVNGASMVLPGGADISTAVGDWCYAYSNASAVWRIFGYQKANGQPLMDRVSTSTDASYTAAFADTGGSVAIDNGSANDFVLPANADVALPIGFKCRVYQQGAGQTTILPGSGVTANATPGLKISAQYGYADVEKRGTNVWFVTGNLSA